MRVLVLYTLPPESLDPDRKVWEFELSAAAALVAQPLRGAFVRPVHGRPDEILETLQAIRPDVVFNLCEAPLGRPDLEPHAAALFEWLGVRFTGCGSQTLALCRCKDLASRVLRSAGIAVPEEVDPERPRFPCIVKPAAEDGSAGIHSHSLCHDARQLRFALSQLPAPSLVQDFVPGREFAVCLWGQSQPDYFSIGETTVVAEPRIITYEAKWLDPSERLARAGLDPLAPSLEESVLNTARAAWRLTGARHYLRIDIRLDAANIPHVLDINPNPAISPRMGICRAVQEAGWEWADFVRKLVEWA